MSISCDVAKDLMPLCIDKLASEDSENLVNEHTKTCENCADFYERMRKFVRIPITTDISPLKKLRRQRWKRVILCVLLSLCVLLTPLMGIFIYDFTPIPLTYEEAYEGVYQNEKGEIVAAPRRLKNVQWRSIEQVEYGRFVFGYRTDIFDFWKSYYEDWYLEIFTQDEILCAEQYIDQYGREQNRPRITTYYVGVFAGEEDTLMHKKSDRAPVIEDHQIGYTTVYLEIAAAVLTVLLAVLWWIFRKKRWNMVLLYASIFCLIWALVTLFVTDGRMLLYYDRQQEGMLLQAYDQNPLNWLMAYIGKTTVPFMQYTWRHVNIALMTLLVWGIVFCTVELIRMRRKKLVR